MQYFEENMLHLKTFAISEIFGKTCVKNENFENILLFVSSVRAANTCLHIMDSTCRIKPLTYGYDHSTQAIYLKQTEHF